jgi:hypothetical protein
VQISDTDLRIGTFSQENELPDAFFMCGKIKNSHFLKYQCSQSSIPLARKPILIISYNSITDPQIEKENN